MTETSYLTHPKVYFAKAYIGMKIPSKINNDKVYSDMKISPKHTLI
jgi:hypothetical protein